MSLQRWTGPVRLGGFRFGEEGPTAMQALRLDLRDGWLCDAEGRRFCRPDALDAQTSLTWRGLPPLFVRHELAETGEAIGLRVVFLDSRGIETPERFQARLLGAT